MPKSWDCECDKMDFWQKDSTAKETLCVCMCVCMCVLVTQLCPTL